MKPMKLKGIGKNAQVHAQDGLTAAEVSPFDDNLSYVHYKGTTIFRKTLKESSIKQIPREFIDNKFNLDRQELQLIKTVMNAQKQKL